MIAKSSFYHNSPPPITYFKSFFFVNLTYSSFYRALCSHTVKQSTQHTDTFSPRFYIKVDFVVWEYALNYDDDNFIENQVHLEQDSTSHTPMVIDTIGNDG